MTTPPPSLFSKTIFECFASEKKKRYAHSTHKQHSQHNGPMLHSKSVNTFIKLPFRCVMCACDADVLTQASQQLWANEIIFSSIKRFMYLENLAFFLLRLLLFSFRYFSFSLPLSLSLFFSSLMRTVPFLKSTLHRWKKILAKQYTRSVETNRHLKNTYHALISICHFFCKIYVTFCRQNACSGEVEGTNIYSVHQMCVLNNQDSFQQCRSIFVRNRNRACLPVCMRKCLQYNTNR